MNTGEKIVLISFTFSYNIFKHDLLDILCRDAQVSLVSFQYIYCLQRAYRLFRSHRLC